MIKRIKKVFLAIPVMLVGIFVLAACSGVDNTALAQCLKQNGAVFFGASWCPYCADQKALFGAGVDALPYVECSVGPSPGSGVTKVCQENQIVSYPTWEFADGSRQSGVLSLETLAARSSCSIPEVG